MFCSKCGKTLKPEDQQCPHCGLKVGESRFAGTPYTSAQQWIYPDTPQDFVDYTYARVNYTTIPAEEQEHGTTDSRTSYRPLNGGAGSAPDEVREDMRAELEPERGEREGQEEAAEKLSPGAIDTLNAVDEALQIEAMDVSDINPAPVESTGRAGISAGVNEYLQKLEASQNRKAARKHRRIYDDNEATYTTPEDDATTREPRPVPDASIDTEQSEVFNDVDEEEMEEIRYGREFSLKDILRVAGIMILAAALVVGGVLWFRHIRGTQSSAPIPGVTESVYKEGLSLIKSRAEGDYVNELTQLMATGGMSPVVDRVSADTAAFATLIPSEPAENDTLFVQALQSIQQNIGNAVLSDRMSLNSGAADAEANSQRNWGIVNDAIAALEAATTAPELTGISNGERITPSTTPTPTPAPTVMYTTLSKGDKNDDVLEMQTRLYQLGFLLDDRDGAFGTKTQTAVKAFQQAAGLEVNGIADAATLIALYSDDAPRTEYAVTTPTPVPTPVPTDEPVEQTEAE